MDLSNDSSNAAKFAVVSVPRGSWPGGAEESIRRYTAKRSSAATAKAIAKVFFFTSRPLKDDRQ